MILNNNPGIFQRKELGRVRNGASECIPVRGRDDLNGPWSNGVLRKKGDSFVITYDDDDNESYLVEEAETDEDGSLKQEVACGFIQLIDAPATNSSITCHVAECPEDDSTCSVNIRDIGGDGHKCAVNTGNQDDKQSELADRSPIVVAGQPPVNTGTIHWMCSTSPIEEIVTIMKLSENTTPT